MAERDSGRVDAVFLNNDMPGRDGVECCRVPRTLPALAGVPIARQVIDKDETMLKCLVLRGCDLSQQDRRWSRSRRAPQREGGARHTAGR